MNRRSMSIAASLALGSLLAVAGPRYLAAGSYSYVGDYSYDRVGTSLYLSGPWQGFRGQEVKLRATLVDRHSWEGIEGELVRFQVGDLFAWDRTNGRGRASVKLTLDLEPRHYNAKSSFSGSGLYKASDDDRSLWVRWEEVFRDASGGERINLNPSTQEFQFEAPEERSEIVEAPRMRIVSAGGRRIVVLPYDDGRMTVLGEFDLSTGSFAAVVNTELGTYVLRDGPLGVLAQPGAGPPGLPALG